MTRIVHVVHSRAFAGVERHVAVLAEAQSARGHDVVIVGGDPGMVGAMAGPDVRHVSTRGLLQTVSHVRRQGIVDIVHAHMTASELGALVGSLGRDQPVVATRHFARRRGASLRGRAISPLIRRSLRSQIAVSRYVADCVDGDTTVVYAGVPAASVTPFNDRRREVLVAQRLEPEKRTETAVRAFAGSDLARRGWTLTIAGWGSEAASVGRVITKLGLDGNVEMLGFTRDVGSLFRRAQLYLAPTPHDAFGLSVVEAMAGAIPVVAAASGGHLETVGPVPDAALYAPGDIDAASRLLQLLARHKNLQARYGEALRAYQQEHFTPERQALDTDRVYAKVLNG